MEQSTCTFRPNSERRMRPVTIDDLPTEMQWEVFSYLDLMDLVSASCVSSRWKQISNGGPLMIRHEYIISSDEDSSEITSTVENIPCLRNIKIYASSKRNVKSKLKKILKFCTDIRDLEIHVDAKIPSNLLRKVMQKFPNLKSLTFPLWDAPSQLINQIGACLELQELVLFNWDNDNDLKPIADGCPNLRHIQIYVTSLETDEYIYLFRRKKHLLQSFVYTPSRFSTYIVPPISECTRLKHVGIEPDVHPLGEFLDEISGLSGLKRLDLGFYGTIGKDEAMKLSKCSFSTTLTTLNLHVSRGVTEDFSRIIVSGLPNIEMLRVKVLGKNGSEGLRHLLEMKKLQHLEIFHWPLSGNLFETLLQCKQIKHLVLASCYELNDKDALRLVEEMKPTYLKITGRISLTNGFLESFPSCETLKELHVDVIEPREQTVRDLKLRHPTTRIIVRNSRAGLDDTVVLFHEK